MTTQKFDLDSVLKALQDGKNLTGKDGALTLEQRRHPFKNLSAMPPPSKLLTCSKDKDEANANGTEKPDQFS